MTKCSSHDFCDESFPATHAEAPLYLGWGVSARLILPQMSPTLFEAASEPKKLLLVPDTRHHDVGELGSLQYFQAIQWVVEQAGSRFMQLTQG